MRKESPETYYLADSLTSATRYYVKASLKVVSPAPARQTLPRLNRIPALDGVRGLAIGGVLFAHAWPYDFGRSLAEFGAAGVDLFFVLSGFLITYGLIETKQSARYFKDFYIKRFARLFPLYYGYLALLAFVVPVLHVVLRTSIEDYHGPWSWFLLYVSNWRYWVKPPYLGHIWSLAVEEQFYVVWPFVVAAVSVASLARLCSVLICGVFVARVGLAAAGVDSEFLYYNTLTRIDCLMAGALVAAAVATPRINSIVSRLWKRVTAVAGLGMCGFLLTGAVQIYGYPMRTVGQLLFEILSASTIWCVVTGKWNPRFLSLKHLRLLGAYSYCIYLIHTLFISHAVWLAAWIGKGKPATFVAIATGVLNLSAVLAAYGAAALSWRFIEQPIMRLRNRFLSRKSGTQPDSGKELAAAADSVS